MILRIRLSVARDQYLDWCRIRLIDRTVKDYKNTLNALIQVIGDPYVDELTCMDVECYFAYLRRDHVDRTGRHRPPISAAGYNAYISRIRPFCRWMQAYGYARVDLTAGIPRMRAPRPIKLRLDRDQVRSLLETAPTPRDRALIAVGFYAALRASEIRSLLIQDVNLTTDTLFVHVWKSKLEDEFPISPEFHEELERWLEYYRRELFTSHGRILASSDHLIPSYRPHRYGAGWEIIEGVRKRRSKPTAFDPSRSVRHPQLIVKAGLRSIGLPDYKEGIHTLRRTAARQLFDALLERTGKYDAALKIVQATLHHASSQQTEIYIGLSSELKARDEFIRSARLLGEGRPAASVTDFPERPASGHVRSS